MWVQAASRVPEASRRTELSGRTDAWTSRYTRRRGGSDTASLRVDHIRRLRRSHAAVVTDVTARLDFHEDRVTVQVVNESKTTLRPEFIAEPGHSFAAVESIVIKDQQRSG
jgi:hypothetical protein